MDETLGFMFAEAAIPDQLFRTFLLDLFVCVFVSNTMHRVIDGSS